MKAQYLFGVFLGIISGLSACAPTAQQLAPRDSIATKVAGTLAVLPTKTTAPSSTPLTPISTSRPPTRIPPQNFVVTFSPMPSLTPMNTLTPVPTSTNENRIQGSSGYSCQVQAKSPVDNTSFSPEETFGITWTIENTGPKDWPANSIDVIFMDGHRIHSGADALDINRQILDGQTAELLLSFKAPKNPGIYTSNWALSRGATHFCKFSITIQVVNP